MKTRRRTLAIGVAALCFGALSARAETVETEGETELAPYQMVRSLQLVQDKIAAVLQN